MKYVELVNVKQGTDSVPSFSTGNILPVTGMPFGTSSFALETREEARLFFNPRDRVTTGIRLTHLPSPWVGDYGNFVMMPQFGEKTDFSRGRASGYRPDKAIMKPHYLNIRFMRYRAEFELAPTMRGAAGRLKWDCDGIQAFTLVHTDKEASLVLDPARRRVTGYTCANTGAAPDNFTEYFVFQFDRDFDMEATTMADSTGILDASQPQTGHNLGLKLVFDKDGRRDVSFSMAASFISVEQAEHTLEIEMAGRSFDNVRDDARDVWESHLSKIEIETDDDEQMRTFYTCLYRMFLFPREFHEMDPAGNIRHYSLFDGSIQEGVMYTDNGFWDTYKTVYPLFSVLLSDRYAEMLEGFTTYYKESGWLPKWLSPGERGFMPGTMIDAIVADAVVKGVVTDKEAIETMLEGMIKHANQPSNMPQHGREGIEQFVSLGYVSSDVSENVNKTLDYSYGDFCIARVAEALGKTEIACEYYARSQYYRNLYDDATKFIRSRDKQGGRRDDFSSFDWGWDTCEGSVWQNGFAVYHDLMGLADLMGGRDAMVNKMDELFATPPYYNPYGYTFEIHEMTEMAAVDFGQCALSNQPSFHIPYIYSCMGRADKAAYWLRKAVKELFNSGETGYPGDEDNGSMGGWYVFTSLGFYPVCPGAGEYVLGSPAVRRAVIHTDTGRDFVINAENNSDERVFVASSSLNNQPLNRLYLAHDEIKAGGELTFHMSDQPIQAEYTDDQLPFALSIGR